MTSINEMRIISMFSGLKNEKKFIYKRCYLRKNLCYKLTKVTSYLRKFVCNCFTKLIKVMQYSEMTWSFDHFFGLQMAFGI